MTGPVAFATSTGYVTVPAGRGTVGTAPASGAPFTLPVDLAAGGVYTVIVVQRDGGLGGQLQTVALGSGAHTRGRDRDGLRRHRGPTAGRATAGRAIRRGG
jgi:hypothetical protein